MAVFGDKSQTGSTITDRILEWFFGSEKQMVSMHSVVTFKNSEKAITTIGFLGLFNVITAINDDGVFLGILDAQTGEAFEASEKNAIPLKLEKLLKIIRQRRRFPSMQILFQQIIPFRTICLLPTEKRLLLQKIV